MIPILCFVAVLVIEYRDAVKGGKEYRELEHFAEFLSDLKNQFYLCKSITESIFRAAEHVPGNLRKRLEEICFLLQEDENEFLMAERNSGHLKYLRLFYIQCRSAIQYGSGKDGTESVFIKNMTELRRDVQNECYQRAQSLHGFSGMGVVTVLPVLFLPMIRHFGRMTLEELGLFYDGPVGHMVAGMFGGITIGCYFLFFLTRQTDRRIYRGKREEEKIKNNVVYPVSGIIFAVLGGYMMRMYGGWIRIVAVGCGGIVGVLLVAGYNKYLDYLRRLGRGAEVLNLQSVVLLLSEVPNITITELLDVLASYAELFQKPLLQCANDYPAEDVAALECLHKEASFPAFSHLAGRLLASERVGIRTAFSELASDRHFFREQQQLDWEQERKKKIASAQIITFLPMIFLLFVYLIVPFLWVSLKQMQDIFFEMEQIKYF